MTKQDPPSDCIHPCNQVAITQADRRHDQAALQITAQHQLLAYCPAKIVFPAPELSTRRNRNGVRSSSSPYTTSI